jgi:hypothetical protein
LNGTATGKDFLQVRGRGHTWFRQTQGKRRGVDRIPAFAGMTDDDWCRVRYYNMVQGTATMFLARCTTRVPV